jgi:Family of unknown function (DUF6510)
MNNIADLMLDGNISANLLQKIFAPDVTLATIRCVACDCVCRVGSLDLHAAPMGTVLNCADCGRVLMRAVDTPQGLWLEMTGARSLRFVRRAE